MLEKYFFIKPNIFYKFMSSVVCLSRTDFEVQLKCFHHEDRHQSPNWPASVSVSVNNRTLLTDGEEPRNYHRPLHFKNICVPGKNTITISVGTCCCVSLRDDYVLKRVFHQLLHEVSFLLFETCGLYSTRREYIS